MKLSVLLPSHRTGPSAISRIYEAASWASSDVEVLIRDNSGNDEKRGCLSQIRMPNCHIESVAECRDYDNASALMEQARGDFIFGVADDDFVGRRSIDALLATINRCTDDPSVVGVTGHYIVEAEFDTQTIRYGAVDSPSALDRVKALIAAETSIILYSARRRTTWLALDRFAKTLPLQSSYMDQLLVMMALLSGRYLDVNRLVYVYDNAGWDGTLAHDRDYSYYRAVGLSRSVLWVHWLLCAYEGAKIILSDTIPGGMTIADRVSVAGIWFRRMMTRLQASIPYEPRTHLDTIAVQLRQKWLQTPSVDLDALLNDLVGFLSMAGSDPTDTTTATKFNLYWSAMGPPVAPMAASS